MVTRRELEQYWLVRTIRSDKDDDFEDAIAQFAAKEENLTGLIANKILIKEAILLAKEQLNFRLWFASKDSFDDAENMDEDRLELYLDFDLATSGVQYKNTGFYRLSLTPELEGLLYYEDEDETKELHVALECLSSEGKTAGANGQVVLIVKYTILEYD